MPVSIPRRDYAAMFGPTTGDRIRLTGEGEADLADRKSVV